MKILCMEQRTDEWYQLRRGKVTASRFADVMAKPGTKRFRQYLLDLMFDFEGVPDFRDDAPWFKKGATMEPTAIGAYQWHTNNDVQRVGLCVRDDFNYIGCSPDGLVGDDGGIECKFRWYLHTYYNAVKAGYKSTMRPQVQGCMYVTGRQWWDVVNYWCDDKNELEKIDVVRVTRDEQYIRTLHERVLEFYDEAQKLYTRRHG